MSRKVAFRQRDVECLLRAAKAVGYSKPSVKTLGNGQLELLTDPDAQAPPLDEFEMWERENGHRGP